jgi:hypothetical protein
VSAVGNSGAPKLVLLTSLLLVFAPPSVFPQTSEAEINLLHDQAALAKPSALTVSSQEGPWKEEFDRICAQTEIATSLATEQLEALVSDASTLIGQLREIEDPWAKVYIFRLEKCREFFEFVLQWQAMEKQGES